MPFSLKLSLPKTTMHRLLVFLAVVLFLSAGDRSTVRAAQTETPLPTTLPAPLTPQTVSLNFRNVDISVMVKFMSDLLEKNIVMDERVKGKVTILSPRPVTIPEAFRVFVQALRMKGFETVEKKGMIFIVPQNQAPMDRELFLYNLENTSAKSVAKTVNSILSKGFTPQPVGSIRQGGLEAPVQIVPDIPSNSLLVSATVNDYSIIKGLLRSLDRQPGEVYVKASLIEISTDKLNNIQVNLLGAVATGSNGAGVLGGTNYGMVGDVVNGATGADATTSTTGAPVATGAAGAAQSLTGLTGLIAGVLTGGSFNYGGVNYPSIGTLLNALQTDSDVKTLSTPEILATDSQKAKITVGEDVPFITGQSQTVGGNVMTMIQRQNVGITLDITPHILAHDRVRLNLKQTITALTNASQLIGTMAVGPTTTKRSTKTILTVRSGQTVVIGGLISSEKSLNKSTIPWLGEIPVLGYLFSSTQNEKKRDDLLIFLTPYIIKNAYSFAQVKHDAPAELKEAARKDGLIQTLILPKKTSSRSAGFYLGTVNLPGDPGSPE
ncbi:type II secretion system protein GspD [Leptospirillum ferriphilum]|jgi:general secretion pathway protein D|uniref:General secretion pathway protein GspD n=4 Tax=Leptospirillum ferriphilum TaxID=178606 RepID=A0A059XTZ8_9BACT|nr:secretin N-terminal domain-containing protein [Leptospirillum ferriphilum]AFS53201.1 putative general secretion pathway protein D [Leptospirillum ferriphilum ML-04]AIA30278.1 general secretion pathway protein GspD [Leptospirillum ferriphilum YSK]OOH75194.1 general secretion pathway protein GspD [Leptospirillum ferriphilum]OOH78820.1 general secretion pathway protein GspD [Leptospirillum ferriphilum]